MSDLDDVDDLDDLNPRVRVALDWMRFVAASVCLVLVVIVVVVPSYAAVERLPLIVLLLGATGAFLGLPVLSRLVGRNIK